VAAPIPDAAPVTATVRTSFSPAPGRVTGCGAR